VFYSIRLEGLSVTNTQAYLARLGGYEENEVLGILPLIIYESLKIKILREMP